MNEEIWNKTGVICGGLSEADLIVLIIDCENSRLREKLVSWLCFLLKHDKEHFVVSFPYEGKEKPTVEEYE